jgi:hypothetical protein
MLTALNNCTATVERLTPATGTWATVAEDVAGYIEPATEWKVRADGPWRQADSYEGKVTDRLLVPLGTDVQANDRVTVTPDDGGAARTYNARPIQQHHGALAHTLVPLADYEPGATA